MAFCSSVRLFKYASSPAISNFDNKSFIFWSSSSFSASFATKFVKCNILLCKLSMVKILYIHKITANSIANKTKNL